jgi:hypothetical protein
MHWEYGPFKRKRGWNGRRPHEQPNSIGHKYVVNKNMLHGKYPLINSIFR